MINSAEQQQDVNIRATYLAAEDMKIAASLLYQAYHDDPIFLDIFKGESDGYEQKLRTSIRQELSAFWQAKQPIIGLYMGETMVGVACLNYPDQGLGTDRFWHWRLKMLLGAGYLSTRQLIKKEKSILDAVPMTKFHLLSFIAIHPLHQHLGLGSHLMKAVNSVLDEQTSSEGIVVYVTTEKYQTFFNEANYTPLKELTVGKVKGTVMVHYR